MKHSHPKKEPSHRLGHWLPAERDAVDAWAHGFAARAEAKGAVKYHPVIEEFADLIADDPIVRMYVTDMIAQVPKSKRYRSHHLKSVEQMLSLINAVSPTPPSSTRRHWSVVLSTPFSIGPWARRRGLPRSAIPRSTRC